MKSIYLSFILTLMGMVLLVSVCMIMLFSSAYKDISFELKNGLMEASKKAIIPEIVCTYELCTQEEIDDEVPYCDNDGYKEICEEVYMDEDEFFEILKMNVENYKKDQYERILYLQYFQNNPLLVKAKVVLKDGIFALHPLIKEEVIIEEY